MQPQQLVRTGARRCTGFASDQELGELLSTAGKPSSGRTSQAAVQAQAAPSAPTAAEPPPAPELPTERNTLFGVYRQLQQDLLALTTFIASGVATGLATITVHDANGTAVNIMVTVQ